MIKIFVSVLFICIYSVFAEADEITCKWDIRKSDVVKGIRIYDINSGEMLLESTEDIQEKVVNIDLEKDRALVLRPILENGEGTNSNIVTIGMSKEAREAKNQITTLSKSLKDALQRNGELLNNNDLKDKKIEELDQKLDNMNRYISELSNKNKDLEDNMNRLMNKLYHPNGETWKQHWCSARETVCNMENAFAGFKTCRYPYIPECGFSSYHK